MSLLIDNGEEEGVKRQKKINKAIKKGKREDGGCKNKKKRK